MGNYGKIPIVLGNYGHLCPRGILWLLPTLFAHQTFKIALYTSSATLGASTTAYSTTNEVSGTGYTAGGKTLPVASGVTSSGTVAYVDFTDVTWSSSSITARGALIYKSATGNPAVVLG